MNDRSATAADDSARLARILEDYLAKAARGRPPDRRALLARHPDLADDIEGCLASLAFIGQAVDASGPPIAADVVRPIARRLGDFQIVHEVGRGGMGVVYEARQLSLDRRVARNRRRRAGGVLQDKSSESLRPFRSAAFASGAYRTITSP